MADFSIEIMLVMSYLTLDNANVSFSDLKFTYKFYFIAKTLSTTKWVELINKEKFTKATLNKKIKVFLMYTIFFSLNRSIMSIYLVKKIQIASLIANKVLISAKYSDFSKVFSKKKIFGIIKNN